MAVAQGEVGEVAFGVVGSLMFPSVVLTHLQDGTGKRDCESRAARLWPGATNDAQTRLRKYSNPPPALHIGHRPQCGLRDRKCPGPSRVRNRCRNAVETRRRHAVRHPADAVAARDAPDAEQRPRVRDAPTSRKGASARQKSELRMGNIENAARPVSRTAYRALGPDRPSGSGAHRSPAHRSPANPMQRSGYPTPKLESHINAHENPVKSRNENCRPSAIPLDPGNCSPYVLNAHSGDTNMIFLRHMVAGPPRPPARCRGSGGAPGPGGGDPRRTPPIGSHAGGRPPTHGGRCPKAAGEPA